VPTDLAATAAYIESQTQMRRYPTAAKLLISQRSVNHTGSSQTAFPCSDCQDCGSPKYHAGKLFDESKSSTFLAYDCENCSQRSVCNSKTDRCEIEQYYSEGSSWTAYEAMDSCYIGGYHNTAISTDNGNPDDIDPGHAPAFALDTRLGCQTEVTGLFKTQLADGILGMCDSKQAFWHQMYRAHKIREKQFSLCYTRPPHALREGSEAGAVTIGGTDIRLHDKTPMVYTTTVGTSSEKDKSDRTGYYDIHVREMYLRDGSGGESVKSTDASATIVKIVGAGAINDEGGVIVDSGTTDTYFSNIIKKQLRGSWEKLAGMDWNHDHLNLNPDEVSRLPTLLVQFAGDVEMNKEVADKYGGGSPSNIPGLAGNLDLNHPYDVVVAIPPSHYMEHLSDGTVTNRLYDTETDGSVLGANAIVGHDVMFDAQNMRIGWAESSCDYSGLVDSYHYKSAMADVQESASEMKKEDQEEEHQENAKEKYDEENTEDEIKKDDKNIEDYEKGGGTLVDIDDDGAHFTRTKHNNSKNIEIPVDDLIDNPLYAGIGLAGVFLLGIFCAVRCCVPQAKKRRRRKRMRKQAEIEMKANGTGYRDDAAEDDEDSSSQYSDAYDEEYDDEYEDSDSYGDSKDV